MTGKSGGPSASKVGLRPWGAAAFCLVSVGFQKLAMGGAGKGHSPASGMAPSLRFSVRASPGHSDSRGAAGVPGAHRGGTFRLRRVVEPSTFFTRWGGRAGSASVAEGAVPTAALGRCRGDLRSLPAQVPWRPPFGSGLRGDWRRRRAAPPTSRCPESPPGGGSSVGLGSRGARRLGGEPRSRVGTRRALRRGAAACGPGPLRPAVPAPGLPTCRRDRADSWLRLRPRRRTPPRP